MYNGIRKVKYMNEDIILEKINQYDEEQRREFAINLLKEYSGDLYAGFRKLLSYFSVEQVLSIFDIKTIKSFFSGSNKPHEYKLFTALMNKDVNGTISYVLKHDELFHEFFSLNDDFFSYDLDYELFRSIILKMGDDITKYPGYFISCASAENQRMLLKEDISDKMLIYMLPRFNVDVISEFFEKDYRAIYLFEKFDIEKFIYNGVKFNDEIVKKKEFFDRLKCPDLLAFRRIINIAEANNNANIIDKRLHDYYDEIISSYDSEMGIFKDYMGVINDPDFVVSYYDKDPFIMSGIFEENIWEYKSFDDNGDEIINGTDGLINFLRDVTSKKLSEVIVDALFEDNIYNVWTNIREMIRFNDKLSNDKKVINEERLKFYNTILNFDSVSSDEKIDLYNNLKDKMVVHMYYDDLRKLKDLSYDLIKEDLFDVSDEKNEVNVNSELTDKYGVKIYDMRDKEYTMLIRGQFEFRAQSNLRRNCYSIIGNDNSSSFGDAGEYLLYYGYNSFENDRVMHVLEQDSFSTDARNNNSPSFFVNRIMSSDEIVRGSSLFSEIDIANVKNEHGGYIVKKPDYMVFYDNGKCNINEYIREAKRLGIPIVMIKETKLSMDRTISVGFDRLRDRYFDSNNYGLSEVRNGRFGKK